MFSSRDCGGVSNAKAFYCGSKKRVSIEAGTQELVRSIQQLAPPSSIGLPNARRSSRKRSWKNGSIKKPLPPPRGEQLRYRGEKRGSDLICLSADQMESENKEQCHPKTPGISLNWQPIGRISGPPLFSTAGQCNQQG